MRDDLVLDRKVRGSGPWFSATLIGTIVCLSACLWESAMRGLAVLFVLIAAQVTPSHTFAANSTQQTVSREVIWGSPRVILRIDPTTTQRQVQLVGQGISGYPTVDITCDGTRWTLPLTRSEFAKNRTTATYAVPEDRAGRMLKAVECRLLIPGQDIAMARQQLRAWA